MRAVKWLKFVLFLGHESDVTCVEWSKFSWKLATCSDDMMHRIWRIQPKDPSQQEFIHGQAELMDSVQYPTKESFLVTSFDKANKIDDECDSDNSNAAKKRRIRSPLKELPQRFSMLQSPNSQSQTQVSISQTKHQINFRTSYLFVQVFLSNKLIFFVN